MDLKCGTLLLGTTLEQQVSKSIFLNLAAGNTLEWYLGISGCITMTIGGGNNNWQHYVQCH